MRYLILIAIILFFSSCKSGNTKQNATPDSSLTPETSEKQKVASDIKDAPASYPELGKFLDYLETNDPLIPVEYYPLLGLDSSNYDQYFSHYDVAAQSGREGEKFLVVHKKYDCTPIVCLWGIRVYTIDKEKVTRGNEMQFPFESEQSYSIAHNMFLLISDQIHDWEENESGAMEAISDQYDVEYLIVLFDGSEAKIEDYTKENLRIIRNYIFAKYGYKFKSEDLHQYFSNYDWYDPQHDDVNDRLTGIDKKIIALIRTAETEN